MASRQGYPTQAYIEGITRHVGIVQAAGSYRLVSRGEETTELEGAPVSRATHQVVRVPQPSRPDIDESGPSVVIAPQAEIPVTPARPSKKAAEATLVIRDKHQADDLRAQVRRLGRLRKWRRLTTVLLWGGASAAAFGFGTAVAFLAASGSEEAAEQAAQEVAGDEDSMPQSVRDSSAQKPTLVAPAQERPETTEAIRPAKRAPSAQPSPAVLSLADLSDVTAEEPAEDAPSAHEVSAAQEPSAPDEAASAPSADASDGSKSSAVRVLSLDDL